MPPTYTLSVPDPQPGIPPGDRWCALSGPRAPLPAILGTADEWLLIAGAIEAGKDRASGALRFMPSRDGGWLDVMTHIDGGVYLTTAELVELAADVRAKLAPPGNAAATAPTIGGRHDYAIRVAGGHECRAPATVEIHPSGGHFEDYTHACDAHVGAMLGHFPDQPDPHHYEVREVTDEERARGWQCCHVAPPDRDLKPDNAAPTHPTAEDGSGPTTGPAPGSRPPGVPTSAPPDRIIEAARLAGGLSPCRKSKRGAAIYNPATGQLTSSASNHLPMGKCTGDDACRTACNRRCIHAETAAILNADQGCREGREIVHAKVVDGEIVASGPPSCVPCAALIRGTGLAAAWLLHADGWRRYPADEFYRLSCEAAPTVGGVRPVVAEFALAMEAKLRKNDHKPGWKNDSARALLARMVEEVGEVGRALAAGSDPAIVLHECADVANFAMMIADVRGGLSHGLVGAPMSTSAPAREQRTTTGWLGTDATGGDSDSLGPYCRCEPGKLDPECGHQAEQDARDADAIVRVLHRGFLPALRAAIDRAPHPSDITREAIIARAKALTAGPWENYEVDDADSDEQYGRNATGPGGWRGRLGEPEDCNWYRDGAGALQRLNQLNVIVIELLGVIDGKV